MSTFMKLILRKTLFVLAIFLSLCFSETLKATHIVGGVIYYDVLRREDIGNQEAYRIKFKMYVYRDAINGAAGFDNPAYFTIFRKNSNGLNTFYENIYSYTPSIRTVPMQLTNPCLVLPPNIRVEEGIYTLETVLPYHEEGYQISYQRCCRNGTISNLVAPEDEGATYTIEITGRAMRLLNTSPVYDNFPPIAICQGQELQFDHKATDSEGHRLSYAFCTPLHGADQNSPAPTIASAPPYTPVRFRTPYSPTYPLASAPALNIDPITGYLTGTPTAIGQYVVGVCVTEYDADGYVLSVTLRDFQFNVAYCEPKVIALLEADSVSADSNHFYFNACDNRNFNFINTSRELSMITGYAWAFDNGFTSTLTQPSMSINTLGTFNGTLIVNPNTTGCRDTAFIHINIAPTPSTNFTVAIDSCAPTRPAVTLNNRTTAASPFQITYNWDLGNGTSSVLENPSVNYAAPGAYTIRLTAKTSSVCSSSVNRSIEYYPPATAAFDATPLSQCVSSGPTTFTNTTTFNTGNYRYVWNFGDGSPTLTSQNATHTYTQVGTYTANLQVTSPWGCVSNFTREISALAGPVSNFTFVYDTCTPGPIQFTSTSVGVSNNSIASLSWDFGTGTASSNNPSYEFPNAGTYQVSLTTNDANGCSTTLVRQIGYYPAPIIADFFADPNLCEKEFIDFSNTSHPANNDYTFRWNFGDGGTSSVMNPTHQFNTVGNFTAFLEIISPYGCRSTYSKPIVVHEKPKANFTVSYDSCQYLPVLITNASTPNTRNIPLVSQFLNLGNGNTVSNFATTHEEPFVVRNDYTINLYVEDANECKDTFTYELNYFPSPVFDVPSHTVEACLPVSVNFDNNTLNDYPGYTFQWQFGNNTSSTDFEVDLTYTERGIYYPTLIVTSPTGCSRTFRDTISVRDVPQAIIAYEYDSCALEPVVFKNMSRPSLDAPISSILWDLGDGNTANTPIHRHNYNYPRDTGIINVVLTVSDRYGCQDDTTIAMKWAPYPIYDVALANTEGCLPLKVTLPENFPYPVNNYRYEWNFGNGDNNRNAVLAEDYIYTQAGTYARTFTVLAPNGCTGSFSSTHIAKPVPRADFNYSPNPIDVFNPEVSFRDASIDAAMWEWHFGLDRIPDYRYMQHPTFTYRDTGEYVVQLVATHMNGCTDTIAKTLDIVPKFTYFLPNAFTPNSDGTNDGFRGTGLMDYIASFEMQIFNRWGEMVFKTNDPYTAWNGRKDNTGEMSQAGVYVVQVILKGYRKEEQVIKGFATLIH